MILVFISQIIFGFSRSLNTRYTARDKIKLAILSGLIVKITWLLNTYIGITAIIDNDHKTIIAYFIGGVIGDFFSFKIKIS